MYFFQNKWLYEDLSDHCSASNSSLCPQDQTQHKVKWRGLSILHQFSELHGDMLKTGRFICSSKPFQTGKLQLGNIATYGVQSSVIRHHIHSVCLLYQ